MTVLNMLAKDITYPAIEPLKDYPELRALGLSTAEEWPIRVPAVIDIVLGQDYLGRVWNGDTVNTARFGKRGPAGTPSHFGLIIHGAVPRNPTVDNIFAGAATVGSQEGKEDGAPPLTVPRARPPPRSKTARRAAPRGAAARDVRPGIRGYHGTQV